MKFLFRHFTILIIAAQTASAQSIHRTACNGNILRLDSLLSNSSIDVRDNRGRSLLHWAVACKQKEVFDYLIQNSAIVNSVDNDQQTPLHVAAQFNNVEYLEYLVDLQADESWKEDFGGSILELAVLKGHQEMTKKLISLEVDINSKNERGSTALEIAQRMGDEALTEMLLSEGADETLVRNIQVEEKWMSLSVETKTPKMLAPNFISTEEMEFGSVFNKDGTEFYYGVDVGRRNEIRFSKLEDGLWTKPKTIISHPIYGYNDPFLSNDETRLYFISNQALDGQGETKDIDIWYAERDGNGWSAPVNAGPTINTEGDEYYISFTREGTMYFASNGHLRKDTSRTDHDIYFSRMTQEGFEKPVLLNSTINSDGYEADVFVAPDESYLIFCSTREDGYGKGDLYISFKTEDGSWAQPKNMGEEINTPNYEYCPFVTKDGKFLLFTSDQDIYYVSSEIFNSLRD